MTSTYTWNDLILVQRVIYLHHFLRSSIPHNFDVASKVTTLAMDIMFFFADRLLHLQAVFRVAEKNATVDVEQHYKKSSSLGMICTNRLMKFTERITNRTIIISLASLPMISGLWNVLYTTVFLVPHFEILIVNKLIAYSLFLYTIASISLQCLCFYFYLSQASLKIMRILENKD